MSQVLELHLTWITETIWDKSEINEWNYGRLEIITSEFTFWNLILMRENVELLVLSVKLAFMSAPDPTKTVFLVTSK